MIIDLIEISSAIEVGLRHRASVDFVRHTPNWYLYNLPCSPLIDLAVANLSISGTAISSFARAACLFAHSLCPPYLRMVIDLAAMACSDHIEGRLEDKSRAAAL